MSPLERLTACAALVVFVLALPVALVVVDFIVHVFGRSKPRRRAP